MWRSALRVVVGASTPTGAPRPPGPLSRTRERGSRPGSLLIRAMHGSRAERSPLIAPRSGGGWQGRGAPGSGLLAVACWLFAAGALGTTLLTPLSGGALPDRGLGGALVPGAGLPRPAAAGPADVHQPRRRLRGHLATAALQPGGRPAGRAPLDVPVLAVPALTPLLALAGRGGRRCCGRAPSAGRARPGSCAALIGLSPFLLQNASYPWSKMVAAGLVLLFLLLIRAAALARRPARARQTFVLAALCAGLGYLAHQTTIFYVLPTLLWLAWRRPRPLFRRPVALDARHLGARRAGRPGGVRALAGLGADDVRPACRCWTRTRPRSAPTSRRRSATGCSRAAWRPSGRWCRCRPSERWRAARCPTVDQLLRIQLAVLTGALGLSGCWLLVRSSLAHPCGRRRSRRRRRRRSFAPRSGPMVGNHPSLLRRPPWLALVVLCGFFGQVMLQPNWHDTGDAADSMTPIVVLGLAYVAREAPVPRAGRSPTLLRAGPGRAGRATSGSGSGGRSARPGPATQTPCSARGTAWSTCG